MNRVARRLSSDEGFGVIEVVVAMVLFALIITGTMYTMLSVLQSTRDSRAQQVAANLAAQDIDLARDYDNLFDLLPTSYTVPLNGDIFTVTRKTEWVNGNGNDVKCGSGGAALSYKRVNVLVTWDNMRSGAIGVRADSVIDPNSRITDPAKGTILVFVRTDGGVGSPGVTVKATPSSVPNGAVAPSPSTAQTDASGCAYILKVQPGNYDITLSHSSGDYVDEKQAAAPTKILGVQKNATASVGFQYDRAGILKVTYASNYVNTSRPQVAANMKTTFSNTYGSSHLPRQADDKFKLHPFQSGYQVLAGDEDACLANDSQEWKPSGTLQAAPPLQTATPIAGGDPVPAGAPMGVVRITKNNNSGGDRYLRAVSVDNPGNGNPGCATSQVLRWSGKIMKSSSPVVVAVPYGSWRFYIDDEDDTTGTSGLAQNSATVTQVTNAGGTSILGSLTGVVNVDPRVP